MDQESLIARDCPVCGSSEAAERHSQAKSIRIEMFTGRDQVFPRRDLWTNCPGCKMEFVPWAPSEEFYLSSYRKAAPTDLVLDEQAADTAAKLWFGQKLPCPSMMEWGSGRSAFLERLQTQGIEVLGFEPNENLRKLSSVRTLDPAEFDSVSEKFSALTIQLSLEHFYDPKALLQKITSRLSKGAWLMFLYHDAEAVPHRLMGSSSPLYDLQHLQIFRKQDMARLLGDLGFKVEKDFAYSNSYSASYWLRLIGMPKVFQLGNFKLKIPAGNRCSFAKLD